MIPPVRSGPWHRTHPTPSWFSSEKEHGSRASRQGQLPELVLLVQVRGRLEYPGRRDPRRRRRASRRSSPGASGAGFLERRVGRAGLQRVGDVRPGLARPAAEREARDRGDRDERAGDRDAIPAVVGSPASPSSRRDAEGALRRLVDRVRFRAADRGRPRRCRRSRGHRSAPCGSGPSRVGRGRAGTRRRRCTWTRGTGTRTTSTGCRTGRGSRGARSAGTAARSRPRRRSVA